MTMKTVQFYTLSQIKVKVQRFYSCAVFESSVFNNEHDLYRKMSVKWSLGCSWAVLYASVDEVYKEGAYVYYWAQLENHIWHLDTNKDKHIL